ncbi:MAG: FAD-dependent oxidoreductase [Candidatus Omnitrophica bacterium]|nr:FAD-dependent oxidoreductase [Candidatus Omnitrophota bacterium]
MIEELSITLIEVIKRTQTIKSFRFIPERKIDFIAGQFLQVLFDENNKNNKDLNKYLSFSSSPTKEYIEFTKRLSESQFSQRLREFKLGSHLRVKAPLGNCVFKEDYKKIGFLIGGIGITPVISMIEYIVDKNLATDVALLYSNRSKEETAFYEELDYWQSSNKSIKVFFIVDSITEDKKFILGRVDKETIPKFIPDFKERMIFTFGPPKMVEAMKSLCLELGANSENIKMEMFMGY